VNEPKKKTDKVSLIFVAALLLGAVLMGWQEVLGQDVLPPHTPAPLFTAERLEGPPLALSSLKGKVVVVNFWATWCAPCREELPYLISTVQDYEAQGVTLVAMNTDEVGSQREVLERFLQGFPQLTPYVALSRPDVGAAYEVMAVPSVYIIDREGLLSASFRGQATKSQLKRWIEAALHH
jgi:thiol-disulfide isomerase/thioredoxin